MTKDAKKDSIILDESKDMLNEAMNMLKIALSKVPKDFHKIKMNKDEERYRERIFCYELYHRFRCLMKNDNDIIFHDITLHGELDKKGNKNYNGEIPDFVLHSPGDNDRNLFIVEVKVNPEGDIEGDLKKLIEFVGHHKYQHGVLICVTDGNNKEKYIENISKSWSEISCLCKKDVQSKISVLIKDNESVEYEYKPITEIILLPEIEGL